MPAASRTALSLYSREGRRKYLSPDERSRFITAAEAWPDKDDGTFCLILAFSGCRISEALALEAHAFDTGAQLVAIRSLKKRGKLSVREVPLPADVLARVHSELDPALKRLWRFSRCRAWLLVKAVMASAGISAGIHACPKGLRHGFGVHAIRVGIPLPMVQRWLGHASLTTTAIYTYAMGAEEREIAARMWSQPSSGPSVTTQAASPDAVVPTTAPSVPSPSVLYQPPCPAFMDGYLPCQSASSTRLASAPGLVQLRPLRAPSASFDQPAQLARSVRPHQAGHGVRQNRTMENKMTDKEPNRPTHIIYQVVGDGDAAFWNRIGAAWTNRDGKGLSCRFDAFPITGRTVIRVNEETPAARDEGKPE